MWDSMPGMRRAAPGAAQRRQIQRPVWWASLLLALVVLLSGCASGATGHAAPHASATPTATLYPPADLALVSMAQAWGAPTIHTVPGDLGNGMQFCSSISPTLLRRMGSGSSG